MIDFYVDGVYAASNICPPPVALPPPIYLNLSICILPEPNIWVNPLSWNFGDIQVGLSSATHTFDVGNSGDADLHVSAVSLVGSDPGEFAITYDGATGTIPPMGLGDVHVEFSPTSSGVKTAILRIYSDDPDTPEVDVNLRGRGVTAPTPEYDVLVQVAFLLDSSGSIGYGNWNIIVNGLADAVRDSDCLPHNGSVELTIVRFGCEDADVPVGPVVITSGNADMVAADIADIAYWSAPCTSIDEAFDEARQALKNSPNFSRSVKQAINLVTDGYPDCYECAEESRDDLIQDLLMTESQDVICCEAIGDGANVTWLRDWIAFPQPGCDWPVGDPNPDCPGWVREVEDAEEFAETICEKLEAILVRPIVCDFKATPTRGMVPLAVIFTNLSTGPYVDVLWDFGDGMTSTQQNPRHVYVVPGKYTVTLTLDGNGTECEESIEALPDMIADSREGPNLATAYLLVSPEQGRPGQMFEISINVGNDGGATGTRSIALYINGELEQSQTVSVSPGSSKLLVFQVTKYEPGTYQVWLEGNEGQFIVIAPEDARFFPGPLGTPGIIVIVVVAVVLIGAIVFLVMRRE